MPILAANQYSTERILATSAPDQGLGIAFGFVASLVRITNLAAVPIRVTLASTSPATTDDPEILPGGVLHVSGILTSKCGVSTTSTTTSTGDDGHRVTVAAWGL